MSTIHHLNQSISHMSDEQALILLRTLRKSRFIMPERRVAVVKAKREATSAKDKRIVNVLQAMSSEDRAALIAQLEEQS
jgi:hypothetical protein